MHPTATWKAVAEQRPRSPPLAFIGNLFFFLLEMCVRVFFLFLFFFLFAGYLPLSLLLSVHQPSLVRSPRSLPWTQPARGFTVCVGVYGVYGVCVCVYSECV